MSDFFTTLSIAGLRWKVEVKKKTSPHLFTIQLFFQNAIFFFSIFIFSRCIQIALFYILPNSSGGGCGPLSLLLAQHFEADLCKTGASVTLWKFQQRFTRVSFEWDVIKDHTRWQQQICATHTKSKGKAHLVLTTKQAFTNVCLVSWNVDPKVVRSVGSVQTVRVVWSLEMYY